MKKLVFIGLMALFIASPDLTRGEEVTGTEDYSVLPKKNKGKKWRIGYLEGGPYSDYEMCLKTTMDGLVELGWIERIVIPYEEGS